MTLIAAFPLHGVPVLIGDLLITATAEANSSSFLPTAPEAAAQLPGQIGARVAGARKKVHLIGSSLSVAWCGSMLAASRVIGKLHERFSSSKATIKTLTNELAQLTEYQEERFAVHIVGWVIDPAPVCFRWNSMWPTELFIDDSHFDGTGEEMFSEILSEQRHASGFGPGVATAVEAAAFTLLAKASRLIDKEIWSGETLRNRFGYCYELAVFDGSVFRYVDQITYLTWEITTDPIRGGYHYFFGPTLIKYRSMGEYSIVQTTHQEGGKATATHVDLITPVHDTMRSLDARSLGRQSIQSTYYCNFLRYEINPAQIVTGPFVTHTSDRALMGHDIKDGKDFLWLNMANINDALGNISSKSGTSA